MRIMNIQQHIHSIELRLQFAGESVDSFCQRADIDRSTWQRWKVLATEPKMSSWERVTHAAESIEGKAA